MTRNKGLEQPSRSLWDIAKIVTFIITVSTILLGAGASYATTAFKISDLQEHAAEVQDLSEVQRIQIQQLREEKAANEQIHKNILNGLTRIENKLEAIQRTAGISTIKDIDEHQKRMAVLEKEEEEAIGAEEARWQKIKKGVKRIEERLGN